MPQITLEYSANILEKDAIRDTLKKINLILKKDLPAELNNCKSRARECDMVVIGDGNPQHALIHCVINVMPGRPFEVRQAVGNKVRELLGETFTASLQTLRCQITVQINELPETYVKIASPLH